MKAMITHINFTDRWDEFRDTGKGGQIEIYVNFEGTAAQARRFVNDLRGQNITSVIQESGKSLNAKPRSYVFERQ